ncbi:MAG: energy transducer TonB [Muribaculaceae bacterium]|nr:energy transducer TonB [Muribaculaceae bacterium]
MVVSDEACGGVMADIYDTAALVEPYKTRMSKICIFLLLALGALFTCEGGLSASAQTCRVRAGNSSNGGQSYLEVYEYDYVNEKPSFPGGNAKLVEFINDTREYPAEAYKKGIQGRVTCSFVVNADGSVSHISVIRGVEQSLNREAVRIMSKMPEWLPGKHDGQTVPVRVVWSVPFRK